MTESSSGRVGIALTWGQFGLGVIPIVGFPAPESDRTKAARETGKAVSLMTKASAPQLALLTHLAQTATDNRYFSPDAEWIETILKSVKGLSENEVERLYKFDWTPRSITSKDLRKQITEVLKTTS